MLLAASTLGPSQLGIDRLAGAAEHNSPAIRIDLNSLPAEVLNCNVCRMRLGLKPIPGGGSTDFAEHDRIAALEQSEKSRPKLAPEKVTPTKKVEILDSQQQSVESSPNENLPSKKANIAPVQVPQTEVGVEIESQVNSVSASDQAEANRLKQFSSIAQAEQSVRTGDSVSDVIENIDLNTTSNSRITSQSALQIELELAKKQLLQRDGIIQQFNSNQSKFESQISELSSVNRQNQSNLDARSKELQRVVEQLEEVTRTNNGQKTELKSQLEDTRRELSVLQANQKIRESELKSGGEQKLQELTNQLTQAKSSLSNAAEEASMLQRQRDGFERELAAVTIQLQNSRAQIDSLQSEAGDLEDVTGDQIPAAQVRKLIQTANQRIATMLARNTALEQELKTALQSDAPKSVESAVAETSAADQRQLDQLRGDLEQQAAMFIQSQLQWDEQRDELIAKVTAAQQQTAQLQSKLAAASKLALANIAEPKSDPKVDSEPTQAVKSPQAETFAPPPAEFEVGQKETEVTDETNAPPTLNRGPKGQSRAPRKTEPEATNRRDF